MTTRTSRPSRAATTASRCPGRKDSKPNISRSAPSTSGERATGSRGARPSASPRSSDVCGGGSCGSIQARDTGPATISAGPDAPDRLRRVVTELVQCCEREVPDAEVLVGHGGDVGRVGHRSLVPYQGYSRGQLGDLAI